MSHLAFLGLGVMGAPMARHLVAAGHRVTVYNRTAAKAEAFAVAHGATVAPTPAAAATQADAVLACVGADADVEAVTLTPDGAFPAMKRGALWVDHTTASDALARRLAAEADARAILALDAPVSGGQAGTEAGKLSIMCGGSDAAMAAARPLLEAYAARVVHVGPPGHGQLAKMANQIAIAGLVQALAEAVHFTKRSGVDPDKVFEAISGGAASSWQMLNRWQTMVEGRFDFGFAVEWMRKDLGLALAAARENGARLPVAALVDQFYGDLVAAGGARDDTSSLVRRLEE